MHSVSPDGRETAISSSSVPPRPESPSGTCSPKAGIPLCQAGIATQAGRTRHFPVEQGFGLLVAEAKGVGGFHFPYHWSAPRDFSPMVVNTGDVGESIPVLGGKRRNRHLKPVVPNDMGWVRSLPPAQTPVLGLSPVAQGKLLSSPLLPAADPVVLFHRITE